MSDTYLIHSEIGKATVRAAGQILIESLRASEAKLGKRVSYVEHEFTDESGESFSLTLSRISGPVGDKLASGGVQSGGPSASLGSVPAATTRAKNRNAKKK